MASDFGNAFAAARKAKGAGSTFMYNGKSYSTNRADDKPSPKAAPMPPKRPDNIGERKWADPGAKENGKPRDDEAPARKPTPGWADPGSIKYRKGGAVKKSAPAFGPKASGKRNYAKGGMVKGKSCGR